MSTEQLPDGLQLAVNIIREAEWPEGAGGNPLDAVLNEHAQRLTLQHHACDLAQRVADLEAERDEWRRIASTYSPAKELAASLKQAKASGDAARKERDELRAMQEAFEERLVLDRANRMLVAKNAELEAERNELIDQRDRGDAQNDMLLAELRQVNTERDELRARLAEIETQEPVALVETSGDQGAGIGWSGAAQPVGAKLYARPVPAQAVPDADAARYRWLKTRPIDAPTNGPDLALWSDSCGDALRGDDADAAIDAAMAAAPEHKA